MQLTDTQIAFLESELSEKGITLPVLQEDLLDHFCCAIEEKMGRGTEFEIAYHKAWMEICPEGLREINDQTKLVFLNQKFANMKKTTFIIGFATAFLAILGCFFKLMHWPGANMLILINAVLFSLAFLPMFFVLRFRTDREVGVSKAKWTYVLQNAMISFIVLAVPYTALKLPGTLYVIISGVAILLFVFLPQVFLNWYRKSQHPVYSK